MLEDKFWEVQGVRNSPFLMDRQLQGRAAGSDPSESATAASLFLGGVQGGLCGPAPQLGPAQSTGAGLRGQGQLWAQPRSQEQLQVPA